MGKGFLPKCPLIMACHRLAVGSWRLLTRVLGESDLPAFPICSQMQRIKFSKTPVKNTAEPCRCSGIAYHLLPCKIIHPQRHCKPHLSNDSRTCSASRPQHRSTMDLNAGVNYLKSKGFNIDTSNVTEYLLRLRESLRENPLAGSDLWHKNITNIAAWAKQHLTTGFENLNSTSFNVTKSNIAEYLSRVPDSLHGFSHTLLDLWRSRETWSTQLRQSPFPLPLIQLIQQQ